MSNIVPKKPPPRAPPRDDKPVMPMPPNSTAPAPTAAAAPVTVQAPVAPAVHAPSAPVPTNPPVPTQKPAAKKLAVEVPKFEQLRPPGGKTPATPAAPVPNANVLKQVSSPQTKARPPPPPRDPPPPPPELTTDERTHLPPLPPPRRLPPSSTPSVGSLLASGGFSEADIAPDFAGGESDNGDAAYGVDTNGGVDTSSLDDIVIPEEIPDYEEFINGKKVETANDGDELEVRLRVGE